MMLSNTRPVLLSAELVLKVRIQNPNARENDFIEIELDRQELTYRSLLRVCCRELDISTEHVEKIRKLPNTMLRKVCSIYTSVYLSTVSHSKALFTLIITGNKIVSL